jgi:hypothetical protein
MLRIFSRLKTAPKITFSANPDYLPNMPPPVPAHKLMPQWFKELPRAVTEEVSDATTVGTVKSCIPVLESLSHGYIIPLWADMHVKVSPMFNLLDKQGELIDRVPNLPEGKDSDSLIGTVVNDHIRGGVEIGSVEEIMWIWCKFPEGFDPTFNGQLSGHDWSQVGEKCDLKKYTFGTLLMKFHNPWIISTPKGWSVYFKNPSNNWSNDIELIEGIVDTDTYQSEVNFPYVWTGSEEGEWVIPRGTPLIQVIPFKRTKTKMSITRTNYRKHALIQSKLNTKFIDRYRDLFWHKRKSK